MTHDIVDLLLQLVEDTPSRAMDERFSEEGITTESLNQIRLIGRTADFFGGYDGMIKLHNTFEKAGGNTKKLNQFWDMTGHWCA